MKIQVLNQQKNSYIVNWTWGRTHCASFPHILSHVTLDVPFDGYTNQGPEEVNGEESYSESDQAHSLQSAGEVKVVHSSPKAQPAWDGG